MARLIRSKDPHLSAIRIGSVVAFFVVWELTTRIGMIRPFLLPGPSLIIQQLQQGFASGQLIGAVQATLLRMFSGLFLAIAIGIPAGICFARFASVRWFCDPLLSIALPMPQVAFLPIFILWFGVGDVAKVVLIVSSTILPIVVQTAAGTESIDRFIVWSAANLGVTKFAFLWEIALPAALPQIFTGIQIALPIALISTIVAEMLMGGSGIGSSIINGMRMSDSPELFGGIVSVGITGYVLTKGMEYARRKLLIWYPEEAARN